MGECAVLPSYESSGILRNEKINYKVREHSLGKVPMILAIGRKEVEDRTVTLRKLGEKQTKVVALDDLVPELVAEATPPDLRQS